MAFRFRKTKQIAPGVKLNISRSGISATIGPRGFTTTIGKQGISQNIGVPGTGLSYHTNLASGIDGRNATSVPIDEMDGQTFELWCAVLLENSGFTNIATTGGSGDQGVDIIAEKDGKKYAIQCKRYASKLGNAPVQEVIAGRIFYDCQDAVVMTNNYFTKGASELAESADVQLWDRDVLLSIAANSAHGANESNGSELSVLGKIGLVIGIIVVLTVLSQS